MMLKGKAIAIVAGMCLVSLAGRLYADNHAEANLADVWYVEVKTGMDDQFTEAFKDHIKYRNRKSDPRKYKTYAPIIGDKIDYYVVRYCCFTWADMDAYREWGRTAKAGEHWNENVDPFVENYRHHIQQIDMTNSNWPEDDDHFQLFGVTTYKHKMGKGGSIEASKAALAGAAKEGGWPRNWAFMRAVGGHGAVELVTPFASYADMAPPEENFYQFLVRNHGEEKARQLLDDWSDNFHASKYTVYRHIPDMSMDAD